MPLSDARFWELIESTHKAARGDADVHQERLEQRLKKLSPAQLIAYQEKLCRKIQPLAANEEDLRAAITDLGADDEFDDLCHWIVSLGKETYQRALADPKIVRSRWERAIKKAPIPTLFGNAYMIHHELTGKSMPSSAPPRPIKKPRPRKATVPKTARTLKVQWQAEFEPDRDKRGIYCLAMSKQLQLVAAGGANGHVRLWNIRGKFVRDLQVLPDAQDSYRGVQEIDIDDAGRLAAKSQDSNTFYFTTFDLKSGRRKGQIQGHWSQALCSGISADGSLAVTNQSNYGPLEMRSLGNMKLLRTFGKRREVFDVATNPDFSRIVTRTKKDFRVWDGRTGEKLRSIGLHAKAGLLDVSPDGRYLLADDGHYVPALLWDLETGEKLKNPGGLVRGKFSADSQFVASSYYADETITVWNLTNTEKLLTVPFRGPNTAFTFAPDHTLIAASANGDVTQWDVRAKKMTAHVKLPNPSKNDFDSIYSPDGKTIFVSNEQSVYCLKS